MKRPLVALFAFLMLAAANASAQYTTIMNARPVWIGAWQYLDNNQIALQVNLPNANWIYGSGNGAPFIFPNWQAGGVENRIWLPTNTTLGYPLADSGDYVKPRTIKLAVNYSSWASGTNRRAGIGFWPHMTRLCRANPLEDFTGFFVNWASDSTRRVELYENGVFIKSETYTVGWQAFEMEIDTETGALTSFIFDNVNVLAHFPSTAFTNAATQVVGIFDRNGNAANSQNVLIYQDSFTVSSDTLFLITPPAASGVTADAATITGNIVAIPVSAAAIDEVAICWGNEDFGKNLGAWGANVSNILNVAAGTPFSIDLENLVTGTNYFTRVYVKDDLGNGAFSAAVKFDTLGAPELDSVEVAPYAGGALFTVNVARPGTNPTLSLSWGYEENDMPNVLTTNIVDAVTVFDVSGIAHGTNCYYKAEITTVYGSDSVSGVYETPGAPLLGAVTHALAPAATFVTANITKPGVTPTLNFYWGYAEDAMTLAESTAVTDPQHVFAIAGLIHGATCYYAVEMTSPFGVSVFSNSFKVAYSYTWASTTAGGNWSEPVRWNPNGVPDGAGDTVTIFNRSGEYARNNLTVTLDTMKPTVVSGLTASFQQTWANGWANGNSITLNGSGNSVLVMDNSGAVASITVPCYDQNNFFLNAPLHCVGETRVSLHNSSGGGHISLGGEVTGPGPLVGSGNIIYLTVPAGVTRTITTPLSTSGNGSIGKRGAGTLVFEGGINTIALSYSWGGKPAAFGGAGTTILSNHRLQNSQNFNIGGYTEEWYLFKDSGNTIILTNNSQFVYNNNLSWDCHWNGDDNVFIVNGAGSRFEPAILRINGARNLLRMEDGGVTWLRHNNLFASGTSNTVWVGSATADAGILDLNTRTVTVNGNGSRIYAAPGGIVTNGTININGGTGNRLVLAGGEVKCTTLTIGANNSIAPVFSQDGFLPVVATTSVTIADGAKITPVFPEEDVLQGYFPVAIAPAINLPAEYPDIIAPPPEKLVWKIDVKDAPGGNKALWIGWSKPATLLIVR